MSCSDCQYNARSGYLLCALHPAGPPRDPCPDFLPQPSKEELWLPELRMDELDPWANLPLEDQVWIRLYHPFYTGICPGCKMIWLGEMVHYDCPECGWVDDL
jgi:hypothetical protein